MKPTTERCVFYACCVLSAAPLLFAHYPPMIDLPQHAAQIATFNNLSKPDFLYKDLFVLQWARPYLGGYLILWALSQFVTVLTALKVLIAVTIITIPMTASRLRACFSDDQRWDWLLLTISYGFAFQWGLFNFIVGVPIVFIFLVAAFRYSSRPTLRTALWLAVFSHALLVIHLLIAAFGCGLACLYILSGYDHWKKKLFTLLPFVSPFPTVVLYLFGVIRSVGQATEPGPWRLSVLRPFDLLTSSIGLPLTEVNVAVAVLIFLLPFFLGVRLTKDRQRLALFVAYVLWMMLGPDYFLGNYFTYNRFALFCVPLFVILLTDSGPASPISARFRIVQSAVVALPVSLIVLFCFMFAGFDREAQGYMDIARKMKPKMRVLGLMYDNRSAVFNQPMYLHFASWYQAEHEGVADFSFSQFGVLVSYKPNADVAIPRGFEWYPVSFDWERHRGWLYDYFIVRSNRDIGAYIFRTAKSPVRLAAKSGVWWLYERDVGPRVEVPAAVR